jgi:uncharacterized protein with PIN domain
MKFAVDRTVGKLARQLRILGYDTLFYNETEDDEFIALADQGRILLSRNTALLGKIASNRFVLIVRNNPRRQLKQVLDVLDLKPRFDGLMSRCTVCNGVLKMVHRQKVLGRVPDHVWTTNERFSECASCNKLYWPGTHLDQCREDMQSYVERKGLAAENEQP